jgi:signal peptide peptidase SppA
MKNFNLIKDFLSQPWAISELSTSMYAPLVAGLFNNNIEFSKEEPILPETRAIGPGSGSSNQSQAINVSLISIKGALTKYDQECGPVGMSTITNWINNAKSDSSIDAIMLRIDSPGSTVVGTQELGDAISETRKVKPVIAFVDDLCCSGGYWIASQCTEIIANNAHAQIGSIGVMMTFQDVQPYYESLGVKFHSIRALQSADKNTIFDELKAGHYDRYREDVLNPLAEKFISIVQTSRPEVKDDQLTGDVYFAHKVIGTLIDSIGNFEYALSRAAELATSQSGTSSGASAKEELPSVTEDTPTVTEEKPNLNFDMKKTINKVIGVELSANAEGNLVLTEAQAVILEAALAQAEIDRGTIAAHEATIGTQTATIAAHLETIKTLGKGPGAETAVAITDTNAIESEGAGAKEDFATAFMRVQDFFNKK